jgi:hypothetical protein
VQPTPPSEQHEQRLAGVVETLNRIGQRHPELSDLISALPADLDLSQGWIALYQAHPASYGKKSLILRCLLGDASAGLPADIAGLTPEAIQRLCNWWLHSADLSGRGHERQATPKAVGSAVGLHRPTLDDATATIAINPLWQEHLIDQPVSPSDRRLRVMQARALSPERAAELVGEGARVRGSWYFDTGCTALDLANTLVYLAQLLTDRRGGRAQNRLSIALTSRWGLKRLSLPEAVVFADAATLLIQGVAKPSETGELDSAASEFPALRRLLPEHSQILNETLDAHARRWTMTTQTADVFVQRRAEGLRGGTQDSTLFFHLPHLLAGGAFARWRRHGSRRPRRRESHRGASRRQPSVPGRCGAARRTAGGRRVAVSATEIAKGHRSSHAQGQDDAAQEAGPRESLRARDPAAAVSDARAGGQAPSRDGRRATRLELGS